MCCNVEKSSLLCFFRKSICKQYFNVCVRLCFCAVYTNAHEWGLVMGNNAAFGNLPLWYPTYEHPPQSNYNDWRVSVGLYL